MKIKIGKIWTGAAGTAKEICVVLDDSDMKDWSATIASWLIDAPRQSPAWRHYGLSIVHLRPMEGVRPARLKFPEATHEVILLAMDPDQEPNPLRPDTWRWLLPVNLVEQLTLKSDAAAKELLTLCAAKVTAGELWAEPPLSGQREPWRSFLNSWATDNA